jgi:hypothetical protein
VLQENQAERDVLVIGRLQVFPKLVGGEKELCLEAEVGAVLDIYRRSDGVRDDFRWSSRLLPTGRGRDSRIVIERVTVDRRGLGLRPD